MAAIPLAIALAMFASGLTGFGVAFWRTLNRDGDLGPVFAWLMLAFLGIIPMAAFLGMQAQR
jgi:hypothetical protein